MKSPNKSVRGASRLGGGERRGADGRLWFEVSKGGR